MQKRGIRAQVTLFVIIGILLLILVFFAIQIWRSLHPDSLIPIASNVPEEFKPVENYVVVCMHQIVIEGIKLLGAHGGYIEPLNPKLTSTNFRYYPRDHASSDIVSFTGRASDLVPYYLFIPGTSSRVNYGYNSMAPTIDEMQDQIARYIEREMPICLGDFQQIEESGFDVASSDKFTAKVLMKEDRTEVYLNHPMNITMDGQTVKPTDFNTIVKFPFLKYYQFALDLTSIEFFTQFSESFTISLINYYSGINPSKLPPFIGITDDKYIVSWNKPNVASRFDGLLTSYVPALQVTGTQGYTPITLGNDEDVEGAFFRSLSMNMSNLSLENYSVSFIYRQGMSRLDIQPSRKTVIRPNVNIKAGEYNTPEDRTNKYRFFYDVSYPLIVEIRGYNESASELKEFSFMFAIESNIIENKPALAWNMGLGTAEYDESWLNLSVTMPDSGEYTEPANQECKDYVSAVQNEQRKFDAAEYASLCPFEPTEIRLRSQTKSLLCDDVTWISGNYSVGLEDDAGQPIEDVTVGYSCGDYDSCFVGVTALDNAKAVWRGRLPICEGGYLSFSKEGYGSKRIPLSTRVDAGEWLATQKLNRVKLTTATIKKHEIQKIFTSPDDGFSWNAGADSIGPAEDIDPASEQVILTIEQTGSDVEQPISNTIIFGYEGVESQDIYLAPGRYKVSATLIDNKGIRIPSGCECKCTGTVFCSEVCYPEDDIVMEQSVWGGLEISDSVNRAFTVTADDLYSGKGIEFQVMKLPDLQKSNPKGACLLALDEMDKLEEYSTAYRTELAPKLIG
jgi:hypothetical protein